MRARAVHVRTMAKQRSLLSFFGKDTTEAVDEPEDTQVAESETCECQACCDPSPPHQPPECV